MRALQLNIRSLNTSMTYLNDYVNNKKIDIVALSETFIKVEQDKFKFKNWTPMLKNREDGYGGVALLTSSLVKIVPRLDYDIFDIEIVWAQI